MAVSFLRRKASEKFQLDLGKKRYRFGRLFLHWFSSLLSVQSLHVKRHGFYSLGFFLLEEKTWILTIILLLNRDIGLPKSYRETEERAPAFPPENSDQKSRPHSLDTQLCL